MPGLYKRERKEVTKLGGVDRVKLQVRKIMDYGQSWHLEV